MTSCPLRITCTSFLQNLRHAFSCFSWCRVEWKSCIHYNGEYKGYSTRQAEVIHKGMTVERLRKAMILIIPFCNFFYQLEIAFSLRKFPEIRQTQQTVLPFLTLPNKTIAHPALSFSTIIHTFTAPLGQINDYL